MKKMFFAFTMFFGLSNTIIANDHVGQGILKSFRNNYQHAKNIEWEVNDDIIKASFILDNKICFVYYDSDGNKVAEGKLLHSSELPPALKTDINVKYPSHYISQIFELIQNNQKVYYIIVSNPFSSITIKAPIDRSWRVYKKEKL